jgi:hypothetical protein
MKKGILQYFPNTVLSSADSREMKKTILLYSVAVLVDLKLRPAPVTQVMAG